MEKHNYEDLFKFFDEINELKKEIVLEKNKLLSRKNLYDICCVYDKKNVALNEIKLRKALNNKKQYKNICSMFENTIQMYPKEKQDEFKDALEVEELTGETFVNELVKAINFCDSTIIESKEKVEMNNAISAIYSMIVTACNNTNIHIYNLSNLEIFFQTIINGYSKNFTKKIMINDDNINALSTLCNMYLVSEHDNLGNNVKHYIKLYNTEYEKHALVKKYVKSLTKTKLENLSYDMFPTDNEIDDIFNLLKIEIENIVANKNKGEYLIPLLDMWYYKDRYNFSNNKKMK